MPTARGDAPRLRSGTQAVGSITSTYAVTNWTVQSDQQVNNQIVVPWVAPYQMLPPEYSRIIIAADGTQTGDGYVRGVFGPFVYWTFGMMDYFLDTYLSTTAYSAAGSLMVYDITDTAIYLNATIYRPIIGQDMEPVFGGWQNVKIRYDFGTVIT